MSPNRIAALATGSIFVLVGGAGIAVSATAGIEANTGAVLLWQLSTNVLLGSLHLVLGLVLLFAAWRGDRLARTANVVAGGLLLGIGFFGLFAVGTPANLIALNGADNVLHFAASTALLATGLGAARATER
ncbi:DUF4383 domain-containing protein [Homoserinibacter sp. GY 40078]|uniref:DUF4383 domain-containing protein n=1 Tax=Homoserinibacter sp. GY 40078 TaxID=2603275 RepID=UPI0011CB34F5|nr:DUF4383 domain-containing protein [Homoserinibacter sp. GY 40078]TXK18960.1 DUF4383 domain-containing protein [Homoserinibacter sp. GY 40078]